MEVRAQNTWKETIQKESAARLHFIKRESSDEDIWFDRTKYKLKGKPIILSAPGLKNTATVNSSITPIQEESKELGNDIL